jgi:hypothetical protein
MMLSRLVDHALEENRKPSEGAPMNPMTIRGIGVVHSRAGREAKPPQSGMLCGVAMISSSKQKGELTSPEIEVGIAILAQCFTERETLVSRLQKMNILNGAACVVE